MSRSAVSVFVFGIYLVILGALLVAIPNVLLSLASIVSYTQLAVEPKYLFIAPAKPFHTCSKKRAGHSAM